MNSMVEDTRGPGIYYDRIELRLARENNATREGHPESPDYTGCYGDDGLPMWSDSSVGDDVSDISEPGEIKPVVTLKRRIV